ncbi:chitinase [Ranunculus cassubicifolius]
MAVEPSLPDAPSPSPVAQSPEPIIYNPPEPATIPGPIPSPSPSPTKPSPIRPSKGVKAAYWPSFNGFPVSSIDTSYFTHIYYAFLLPDTVTYKLVITPNDESMLPSFVSTLRAQKSTVKTMLSIGGAGNITEVFSAIANTSSNRAIFIQSAIEIARHYGFDGVDIDWEFPLDQQDMDNLGVLYKEWRKALNNEAMATGRTRLLLTSAVYYSSTVPLDGVTRSYPGESICKHVDWVSPMCYDYHGSWENNTGLHSALFDPRSVLSTQYGLHSWLGIGVPQKKLVMGLPVYGHTWTLKDPNLHTVGAEAVGIGPGFGGFYSYSDVANFNRMNNATVVYDPVMESMYSYAGNIWIGYDDPNSVGKKVQFARSYELRGYFFWALGQDLDWDISRQGMNLDLFEN